MLPPRLALTLCALAVSSAVACSALPGGDSDGSQSAVSVAGRWQLPAAVAAVGKNVHLHYDGAPAWNPARCAGGLKSGGRRLGEYLQDQYSAITSVGGYSCRRNTANSSEMSVHGTGRALDIFIPTINGAADNSKGDPLANWLVTNSERIGIQLIIWDHTVWQANGRGDKTYTGPIPHVDHLHVELTLKAAAQQTPWFLERDAGDLDLDDAGTAPSEDDAGVDEDPNVDPDSTEDAGSATSTPTTGSDAGTTTPVDAGAPAPAPATDDSGDEPPPIEDEPHEGESTGIARRSVTPSSAVDDGSDATSGGCSAAPARTSGGIGVALGLALAACLVRRRRR